MGSSPVTQTQQAGSSYELPALFFGLTKAFVLFTNGTSHIDLKYANYVKTHKMLLTFEEKKVIIKNGCLKRISVFKYYKGYTKRFERIELGLFNDITLMEFIEAFRK